MLTAIVCLSSQYFESEIEWKRNCIPFSNVVNKFDNFNHLSVILSVYKHIGAYVFFVIFCGYMWCWCVYVYDSNEMTNKNGVDKNSATSSLVAVMVSSSNSGGKRWRQIVFLCPNTDRQQKVFTDPVPSFYKRSLYANDFAISLILYRKHMELRWWWWYYTSL